ncbi:hypothetical protein P5P86_15550 [Nocardioides sp. BP30]|uniref:hypothetical protein n=1 Tax=Nocardioides sp. BP30 TaxID=3036374 RepID=UPI0024683C06|nr:hypothetical protein [Nocardioides sp. BP30]WGL51369.1 hypothetical protein P5P86_15550 [Nocardioides sp. BP30]
MGRNGAPAVGAMLWRARIRFIVAFTAVGTAVHHWHGWLGWALGLAVAGGLMLFELPGWWRYVTTGEHDRPPEEPRLAGTARFRQPGTTNVRLLSVGGDRARVARRLGHITGLDEVAVDDLLDAVPTALPRRLSVTSAEEAVNALRDVGAEARMRIQPIGLAEGHSTS